MKSQTKSVVMRRKNYKLDYNPLSDHHGRAIALRIEIDERLVARCEVAWVQTLYSLERLLCLIIHGHSD